MSTKRITELDFDSIKNNLKNYLATNGDDPLFGSYNFEGSVMSAMLDVLAYNTHYNAFYVNMLASEMFLDSAIQRTSVASIAKHLGYTPKSPTCASVTVTVDATGETVGNQPIAEYSKFRDKSNFTWYTLDSYSTGDNGSVDVPIYEGELINSEYVVTTGNPNTSYLLSKGADTSTLKVTVRDSYSNTTALPYFLFSDISELTPRSNVYFLNEVEDQRFELVFGDGVFGRALSNGNVIQLVYMVSSYDESNDINTNEITSFEYADSGNFEVDDSKTYSSSGAKSIESTDSIKFLAPKSFQSQNRTVTAVDYKNFVLTNFSNARSVLTWGGEDNDPPAYGKVFIAVRPTSGYFLTETDRSILTNDVLAKNKIIGITPEIVDPDYTHIKIDTVVKYNPTITLRPAGTMGSNVKNVISRFVTTHLDEFGGALRSSQLYGDIDDSDGAIFSNYTTTTLYKTITPESDSTINTDQFKFNSTFVSFTSDLFTIEDRSYPVKFGNDGNLVTILDENGVVVIDYAGTISSNGEFRLLGLNITSTDDINIYLTTDQIDIIPLRNQILTVKEEDITVSMIRG